MMEINEYHYKLRNEKKIDAKVLDNRIRRNSSSRLSLRDFIVPNYKEPDLEKIEYNEENRNHERFDISGEVTNNRRNSEIHEKEMKIVKRNKRSSTTRNVTNNQSISVEQKHKDITPCRVLLTDYLSEEKKRRNSWSKSGSVYETYNQIDEFQRLYSETDSTYSQDSQASQCRYKVASNVLTMSNTSKLPIHKDDNRNNFVSLVSYQNQLLRRTSIVSKDSQLHSNISEDISHTYTLDSADKFSTDRFSTDRLTPHENMYRKQHAYTRLTYKCYKTCGNLWIWALCLSLLVFGESYCILR